VTFKNSNPRKNDASATPLRSLFSLFLNFKLTRSVQGGPQRMRLLTRSIQGGPQRMRLLTRSIQGGPQRMRLLTRSIQGGPQRMRL